MIENAFEVAKRADQDKGLEIVIEAGCGASLRLPMIGPEAHRRVPAKLVAVWAVVLLAAIGFGYVVGMVVASMR